MTDYQNARSLAEQLTALSEATRIQLVHEIAQSGPCTVGVLARRIGAAYVNVSHHLGRLRAAGVLTNSRDGRRVAYSFAEGVFVPSRKDDELGTLHFGGWRISIGRMTGS
ncbi:ArsR/SmtB family transcription factor [Limnoglobus roseus]|uniref:ArsR family transcriptional regulator n=1 Tax=Limnoglobus roseus TaxID=2598579 RepID=A0A5C1AFT3_9BACT|nr:metalloregulator ArsR/SmtB family transcription factor [Limnoglobus roseus]QEL17680.1 ArsR family transcriptional regulator [Limnoglobus roseus]